MSALTGRQRGAWAGRVDLSTRVLPVALLVALALFLLRDAAPLVPVRDGFRYIANNRAAVWSLLLRHLQMTGIALLVATLVALPLGILINRYRWLGTPVMGALGILYTVPSLALIILLLPIFGLGQNSVIVALILYTQVILVRNTVAGLRAIDPAILEAARGMGMNGWQTWWRVQFPLALPIVLAGVRIAAIVAIGIAAIGAKFNAGGLGTLLFDGIARANRADMIWAGAIAVSALALVVNVALLTLERALSPATRIRRAERQARVSRQTLENAQMMQG